jgi:hypothetical protein
VSETLKTKGQPLPTDLVGEWDDKRDAAWTPMRSPAAWKCPQGHRYTLSRAQREAAHVRGEDPCPHPRHVRAAATAKAAAPIKAVKFAPTGKAALAQQAAAPSGLAADPGSPEKATASPPTT